MLSDMYINILCVKNEIKKSWAKSSGVDCVLVSDFWFL